MSYLWNFPPPPCAVLLVLVWDTVIIVAGLLAYVPNHLLRKSSSKTQHNEDSIGKHRGQMEKPTMMAVDLGTYDHLVQGFFGLFLRRQHWTIQQQYSDPRKNGGQTPSSTRAKSTDPSPFFDFPIAIEAWHPGVSSSFEDRPPSTHQHRRQDMARKIRRGPTAGRTEKHQRGSQPR